MLTKWLLFAVVGVAMLVVAYLMDSCDVDDCEHCEHWYSEGRPCCWCGKAPHSQRNR